MGPSLWSLSGSPQLHSIAQEDAQQAVVVLSCDVSACPRAPQSCMKAASSEVGKFKQPLQQPSAFGSIRHLQVASAVLARGRAGQVQA